MNKVKFINIKIFLVGVFILGIMNIPDISFADDTQIQIQDTDITIETSPNNPQPYEDVTISLSSYATDLNKAIMTWSSSTTGTVLSGIGKTSYSFKTGGPNTSNVFSVNITPVGSLNTITRTIAILPSEVEIMWESVDGYVPPFYKGKALPVSGGLIKAVAIPNTNTIRSGNGSVSYTWSNSGDVVLDASGYNKNSYIFKNSMFDTVNTIGVIASSVNSGYRAENEIEIPVYKPKLVFYKKSPTEGIVYNNALDKEASMTEDEVTIVAEPYFTSFNRNNDNNNFSYSWQINGNNITTPLKKTELTVRPTSHGGYATINLTVANINDLFQKISNELKLNL